VYAERAPLFANEDLELVKLLADQAAVILESRALIDNVARVQAREEATRLKDDFLSAAAHDLKTPLTTLLAQAQMLERRILADPSRPVDLQKVQVLVREAQRLKALVLELLDAARVERRLLTAEREQVDLLELARETCETWTTGRHPCTVVADGPLVGEWDPLRLSQLFQNLVENAIKYSPDGGSIEIHLAERDGQALVQVTDHGIGIPVADLPQIFERFHRASNVDDRRFSGMGLGLYICRGIVEEHGGQIEAKSQRGAGTSFLITLPLRSSSAAATPALATA
jgi:signal transduction histidine kinase